MRVAARRFPTRHATRTTPTRLLASDFPYVTTLGGGYVEAPRAVLAWRERGLLPSFTEEDFANLFSGTFERVFGE